MREMLVEERQSGLAYGQQVLAHECPVARVGEVVEHHGTEFEDRGEVMLGVRPHVRGGDAGNDAPEGARLREVRPVVMVVLPYCSRVAWKLVPVHAEERHHHLEVAGLEQRPVHGPGVLEPVLAAPVSVVGNHGPDPLDALNLVVADPVHGEEGAIELDRVPSPPGARSDKTLEGVALRHLVRLRAAPCEDPASVPEGRPPESVLPSGVLEGNRVGLIPDLGYGLAPRLPGRGLRGQDTRR